MRIVGGSIFMLGTSGLGLYQVADYELAIAVRKQVCDMLRYLIAQIQVEHASIPDSICKVSARLSGVFGEILQTIQKHYMENEGKPLFIIWQEKMQCVEAYMSAEDAGLLIGLFDQTGFYDTKTQLKKLQMTLDVFEGEIKELEEQKEKRCRLYQSMGLMVGIFVIILLW